jgi:hypothetical protein
MTLQCLRPTLLLVIWLTISGACLAQNTDRSKNDLFGRKYRPGESYSFRLTMEEFHGGGWDHTNIAECELKVVVDSAGIPYDEVRWVSMKVLRPKDSSALDMKANAVTPYRISLNPGGKIDLPRIGVPEMTEPIQDFNTFFVAVSPLVGISGLKNISDSFVIKDPVKADFSNGAAILKGEDCIAITVRLKDLTREKAMLYTSFFPANHSCLSFLLPEMNTPVVGDTVNNFQMVLQMSPDKYLVQFGRELFYINSTIRRSDGKITDASMFNRLDLKMKINCDKDYKSCQMEMPFSEERKLKLELL